jgi:4-hydroxythreonine-4-phosphate dehydrogenase
METGRKRRFSGAPFEGATPLAVTLGEPAGIGPEITVKAWQRLRESGPCFVYMGAAGYLQSVADELGLDVPVWNVPTPADAARVFDRALPAIEIYPGWRVSPGEPSEKTVRGVVRSISEAVLLANEGKVLGLVTNPIQKAVMQRDGFEHPGHTEYLQELAGPGHRATMMLACEGLRVVPVTIHQSLKSAIAELTVERIVETAVATDAGLRKDFGIASPRLAVAGLNPHAGEDGTMGDEEILIIAPAIQILRERGLAVEGPFPPDTMFTSRARSRYDAAICMYHDQALIPLKTLDMDGGVNVTLGLPFVRTSPDHGTALDIAGKGIADPGSLIAAIRMAHRIGTTRQGVEQS